MKVNKEEKGSMMVSREGGERERESYVPVPAQSLRFPQWQLEPDAGSR